MFKFVIMANHTEVSALTKAFLSQADADAYGHDLNFRLKTIGLRAKWMADAKHGYAIPDNTKYCEY